MPDNAKVPVVLLLEDIVVRRKLIKNKNINKLSVSKTLCYIAEDGCLTILSQVFLY